MDIGRTALEVQPWQVSGVPCPPRGAQRPVKVRPVEICARQERIVTFTKAETGVSDPFPESWFLGQPGALEERLYLVYSNTNVLTINVY